MTAVISPKGAIMYKSALAGSIVLLIQSVAAVAAPSTLFGMWKGSTYKERRRGTTCV